MPIYEYQCPACGVFEVMQGIKEGTLTKCPKCKCKKVKKLISETSFQLKGSGWYVTDYGKGKGGGNGKKNGTSDTPKCESTTTESTAKTETKTESKPAASTTAT